MAVGPNAAGHALMALEMARALGLDAEESRVVAELTGRIAVARHPQWPLA